MINSQQTYCERAEIVFEKPLSGQFEEILFGSASGNTLWIRFFDPLELVEWIGKFDCGGFGGNKVTKTAEPDKFFVCAGGWVYFVDGTKRKLLGEPLREDCILDAIYDPVSGGVLAADWSTVSLIKAGTEMWSVGMGTDGIRNLALQGKVLKGLGEFDYDGSEREFSLDLETKKLKVGRKVFAKPDA
jgi:hypothetical protein